MKAVRGAAWLYVWYPKSSVQLANESDVHHEGFPRYRYLSSTLQDRTMVECQPGTAQSTIRPTYVPPPFLSVDYRPFYRHSISGSIRLLSSYALTRHERAAGSDAPSMVRIRFRLSLDETWGLSSKKLDLENRGAQAR